MSWNSKCETVRSILGRAPACRNDSQFTPDFPFSPPFLGFPPSATPPPRFSRFGPWSALPQFAFLLHCMSVFHHHNAFNLIRSHPPLFKRLARLNWGSPPLFVLFHSLFSSDHCNAASMLRCTKPNRKAFSRFQTQKIRNSSSRPRLASPPPPPRGGALKRGQSKGSGGTTLPRGRKGV